MTLTQNQQDRLLNLRLMDEIDEQTFGSKSRELRDQATKLTSQIDHLQRSHTEKSELALKVFELSQTLKDKWFRADVPAKRRLLDIVCLNFSLDDVTLVPQIRKPFDVLAEGHLVSSSRGERI